MNGAEGNESVEWIKLIHIKNIYHGSE